MAIHSLIDGQEFSAVAKKNGTSQVRIGQDILADNIDTTAKKFDAISDSGGHAYLQVGNVQVVAGPGMLDY